MNGSSFSTSYPICCTTQIQSHCQHNFSKFVPYFVCVDPENFARGGSTLMTFFFDGRREDPNTTKSEPSLARQGNAI